jgi:hypothetical protein
MTESDKERSHVYLKSFFRSFQQPHPWCYGMNLEDTGTNNVSHLLGINSNALETLFKTAEVLGPYGKTGSRNKHKTMEAIVASVDHAEYLTYCGKRDLKLGEGGWIMDLQSLAEKRRAPHLLMSSKMASPRVQLKQTNDELTSGNYDSGGSVRVTYHSYYMSELLHIICSSKRRKEQ